MEKVKEYIQFLPLLEQIALSAWLGQVIQQEAEAQAGAGFLAAPELPDGPPHWMWKEAEKAFREFESSGTEGLSWEEVKEMGNQRKKA